MSGKESADGFYALFLEGIYVDGDLWYTFYNGKQNLVVQNAGTETATISIPVNASAAELLNSAAEATLENGSFSIKLTGRETVFISFYDTKPAGIYVGNILYRRSPTGKAKFCAERTAYCAVFKAYNNKTELIRFYVNGDTVANEDESCMLKILNWDSMKIREEENFYPEFFKTRG